MAGLGRRARRRPACTRRCRPAAVAAGRTRPHRRLLRLRATRKERPRCHRRSPLGGRDSFGRDGSDHGSGRSSVPGGLARASRRAGARDGSPRARSDARRAARRRHRPRPSTSRRACSSPRIRARSPDGRRDPPPAACERAVAGRRAEGALAARPGRRTSRLLGAHPSRHAPARRPRGLADRSRHSGRNRPLDARRPPCAGAASAGAPGGARGPRGRILRSFRRGGREWPSRM
jgi:hypothetical protein